MTIRKWTIGVGVTALLGVSMTMSSPASAAPPRPKKYSSCAQLNQVYPHGVGRKGAKDKVARGKNPVRNFFVDSRTYQLNHAARDRDGDGIACEKH